MLARDVTQGTGLGLYICWHLMSYMGGSIGLESSVLGKGSVFVFTVPIATEVMASSLPTPAAAPSVAAAPVVALPVPGMAPTEPVVTAPEAQSVTMPA